MDAIIVENLIISAIRTIIGLLPATIIAYLLYSYNILVLGPVLLFFVNLLFMGWWIALGIVSLHNAINWPGLRQAASLNLVWMLLAILIFSGEFRAARVRGALISIGE
jgi:hypothetical protein